MSVSYSNKPIVILKTSFTVSFISATSLGIFYSLNNEHTFNQFLYITYMFFVNNLLMPVSIVAIVCYYISRDKMHTGIMEKLKTIGILSIVSLVMLFVWNMMDFLFHYHREQGLSLEYFFQDFLMLGILLAVPISVLIFLIYDFMDAKK